MVSQIKLGVFRFHQPEQHAIAAFIAIFIFAPVFWMLMDRVPPYLITNGRIEPQQIAPNEPYIVDWDVKPLRNCPGARSSRVTTFIIDNAGGSNAYATTQGGFIDGVSVIHKEKKMLILPPGPAKYYSEVCYPCNPLQDKLNWPICFLTPVLEFEVLAETK